MPQIPQDFDKEAETDEAIFQECAERLKLAEEAESINRTNAIDDLEFADGQQWPDDLYNMRKVQGRPSLTINHTGTLVRRVVNNMKEQRPRIKVHPVGEGVRIEDAKVANGLIRHVEYLSNADVAYDQMGESAVRIGWGYLRILNEYIDEKSFDQELKIKGVRNTLTGYIDPSAEQPDGSDMNWFIFSTRMKRRDFKRQFPGIRLADWTQGGPGDSQHQWLTKEDVRLAEYYRVKKRKDTLLKLTDGRSIFKSEFDKEAFRLAGVAISRDDQGKEITRPTERRQIQWFLINGTTVVDRRDLPGHYIPVVRCEGNVLDLNGDVRRKGMIRDMKDPARMFNYWETAKTEKLALSSKAPWVGVEGQFDGHPEWDDANQKPYSVLKYKLLTGIDGNPLPGVPPPQRQAPAEVEAGFAEAGQSAVKNLLMVAGMPHDPQQDTPGTVVSGIALRRRQAISDISHFQYYDNQTMAIAQVGRILLDLFPYYYGEERMQRIIGEDGVPQMVKINEQVQVSEGVWQIKNNLSVGRYDVVMDTGPGYETKRQEAAESMIDLLKTPLAEPIIKAGGTSTIIRNFDFPGADDLADLTAIQSPQGMQKVLEGLPQQAKGIVQALQAQNQQLTQALQAAHLEIKYKSGIEQLRQTGEDRREQARLMTKVHDVDTRARTELDRAHIQAQASIAETEISGAVQLMNTNQEAAHNREAAKELQKSAEKAEKGNGSG